MRCIILALSLFATCNCRAETVQLPKINGFFIGATNSPDKVCSSQNYKKHVPGTKIQTALRVETKGKWIWNGNQWNWDYDVYYFEDQDKAIDLETGEISTSTYIAIIECT